MARSKRNETDIAIDEIMARLNSQMAQINETVEGLKQVVRATDPEQEERKGSDDNRS